MVALISDAQTNCELIVQSIQCLFLGLTFKPLLPSMVVIEMCWERKGKDVYDGETEVRVVAPFCAPPPTHSVTVKCIGVNT